jgi:hypothetical protein
MQIRYGDHDPARHKGGFITDALETFVPAHLLHNQLKTAEWEKCVSWALLPPLPIPPAPLAPGDAISYVFVCKGRRVPLLISVLLFLPLAGASIRRMQSSVAQRTSCPCIASTYNMRASGSATVPQFSPVFWPNTSVAVPAMPSTTRAAPIAQ